MLRRIFVAWVVIYGKDLFFVMQINLIFAATILQIAIPYIVDSKFEASDRRMATFSETITLFIAHSFIMFNMVSVEDNFTIGYWAVAAVGTFCVVCFIIILIGVVRFYKIKWRRQQVFN